MRRRVLVLALTGLSLDVSSSDRSINHTSHICLLRGPGLAEQVLGCNVLNHDAHVVPIDVLDVAFAIGIYGDDVLRPAHHLQLLCDDPECPWRLLPMAPRAPRRPEAALRRRRRVPCLGSALGCNRGRSCARTQVLPDSLQSAPLSPSGALALALRSLGATPRCALECRLLQLPCGPVGQRSANGRASGYPQGTLVAARALGPWQLAGAAERHRPPRVTAHHNDWRMRSHGSRAPART